MIASNPRGTATCSKCRASHYCGQACQRRSWASPSVKLKPLSRTRSCGSLRSVIISHDVVSQVWRACWSDLGHVEMSLQISVLPGEILDCIRIRNDQILWNSAIASTYLMKLPAMFHHFKLTFERQFVSRATLVPQILAFENCHKTDSQSGIDFRTFWGQLQSQDFVQNWVFSPKFGSAHVWTVRVLFAKIDEDLVNLFHVLGCKNAADSEALALLTAEEVMKDRCFLAS